LLEIEESEFNAYLNNTTENVDNSDLIFPSLIDIGLYSNQWWNTNSPSIFLPFPINEEIYPSEGQYQTYAIPVAGAVYGSTVVVGKLGKWISNLF